MNLADVSSSGGCCSMLSNSQCKAPQDLEGIDRAMLVWQKMLFRFAGILASCAILERHWGHLAYPALTFGLVLKGSKEDQLFKLVLTFTVAKCCSQLLPYFRITYKVWAVLQTSISSCDHSTLTWCGAERKGRESSYFVLVVNWRVS